MPRRAATVLLTWIVILVALAGACARPPPPAEPRPEPLSVGEVAVEPPAAAVAGPALGDEDAGEASVEDGDPGPVPVTRGDPVRGKWSAPVTLVLFSDFECPFCKRLNGTLNQLRSRYGPDQLRIVWKNNPLPFHKNARPAAEAAMALFAYHGPDAFWSFHDALFDTPDRLSPALEERAVRQAGVSPVALERLLESGAAQRKVDADMALAKQLGAMGTPASFINGVRLSGAQPLEKFAEIIDAQLEAARALRAEGFSAARIYATLAQKNYTAEPARPSAAPDPDDTTVHLVPVGDSPVRGKATALVTVVMFSEHQCPFCAKVLPTVEQLSADYGDDLRVVWKGNPLPFHPRAEPAAQLALEARAQKGDAAFWKATELLFAGQRNLDDASLEGIAAALKLNVPAAKRAIATHKYKARIEADQELADDLQASGTPHFFINGRRLVGAQPLDKFKKIIDEELVKARALVAKGTPRAKVYEAIQKHAAPPPAPERKSVAGPAKASPIKGAPGGKVVVQMFGDFQCPFCARVAPTIDELVAAFPGKVQVVWRHLPLPMHSDAQLAAEAAMEAHAQKGSAGFWKMHDLLFQNQRSLDRASLEQHAAAIGLDMARFRAALDSGTHRAAVDADRKAAEAAGISGTPAFVINGYFVSGAQPLSKLKKVVRRALAEK